MGREDGSEKTLDQDLFSDYLYAVPEHTQPVYRDNSLNFQTPNRSGR